MEYLLDSKGLFVVNIAGMKSNLALSVGARINVNTNETIVSYSVRIWNDRIKRLNKQFDNAQEAIDYYNRLNNKFGSDILRELVIENGRITQQEIVL